MLKTDHKSKISSPTLIKVYVVKSNENDHVLTLVKLGKMLVMCIFLGAFPQCWKKVAKKQE